MRDPFREAGIVVAVLFMAVSLLLCLFGSVARVLAAL